MISYQNKAKAEKNLMINLEIVHNLRLTEVI